MTDGPPDVPFPHEQRQRLVDAVRSYAEIDPDLTPQSHARAEAELDDAAHAYCIAVDSRAAAIIEGGWIDHPDAHVNAVTQLFSRDRRRQPFGRRPRSAE